MLSACGLWVVMVVCIAACMHHEQYSANREVERWWHHFPNVTQLVLNGKKCQHYTVILYFNDYQGVDSVERLCYQK